MTALIVIGYKEFTLGVRKAVEHVFGGEQQRVSYIAADYDAAPEKFGQQIRAQIENLDDGSGIVILADIYGATHTNTACRLLQPGRVELVSGLNLPMLLRALNYRHLPMNEFVDKLVAGGREGILHTRGPGTSRDEAQA